MTDTLQKLEEKIILLLTELEDLRFDVESLAQENDNLKAEKTKYTQKLQSLITLLDTVDADAHAAVPLDSTFELEAMQGPDEYAMT